MSQPSSSPVFKRACQHCRHRKIRCDRTFPCSGCRVAGVPCIASKGVEKPKQARVLISSQYERKIDLIERKLDRLGDLVERLTSQLSSSRPETPLPKGSSVPTPTSSEVSNIQPDLQALPQKPRAYPTREKGLSKGQSSLSAHSSFAVDFLHNAVGSEEGKGAENEFRALLDTISPIVDAFTSQPIQTMPLFPFARPEPSTGVPGSVLPPIETAVALLRLPEGEENFDLQWTSQFLTYFLPSRNLSDLCLKIYFSQTYSNAEFIILNIALYFLGGCIQLDCQSRDQCMDKDYRTLMSTCQSNLETALSQLSLYTEPSYEMTLALTLGAMYAIDSPRNLLASVLVRAASHAARTLEYHTRSVGTDALGELNSIGLLFWIIYFLEKMLSLRNGRSSSIVDAEITFPLPRPGPSNDPNMMGCARNSIKIAGLAGRIYAELYCAESLSLPAAIRTQRATSLSQELDEASCEARAVNELWAKSTSCSDAQTAIKSMLMSDEVLRLSMSTLIHRAMPVSGHASSTFTDECILSARAALRSHQAFIQEFGLADSVVLTTHIVWSILFVPFVPFIVLFCHSIETGDVDDLSSMQAFVASIESACPHSPAIAKHHRLFQVFCTVATRYCELKARPVSLQPEQMELRMQLDAQLSTFGFIPQPHPSLPIGLGDVNAGVPHGELNPGESSSGLQENDLVGDGFNLGDWFSFSQNMVALLDNHNM
ncbi:hypothetical protein BJX66DRAFT_336287 [Aspergillus keveii]|uniref:Zn(2)-C6 fungal-type domain-containing protein n=1 Tax=Aspergillus keveii TaxID=714993 RepID=A0ABR4GAG0_9EURO